MGIFGLDVTIVVDVANVMGSRPDGWWRDRAGAAVRLHDQIAELAASGRAVLPGDDQPPGERRGPAEHPGPGEHPGSGERGPGEFREHAPAFVLVLEGAARAAIPRLPSARPGTARETGTARASSPGGAGSPRPGEVRVVEAQGSGDDAIVAVVRELPGRRVVVTADRELRARCAAAGAEILGPGWLLGLLREPRRPQAPRG
jgi:8-oxo-dGTP diphosphatase